MERIMKFCTIYVEVACLAFYRCTIAFRMSRVVNRCWAVGWRILVATGIRIPLRHIRFFPSYFALEMYFLFWNMCRVRPYLSVLSSPKNVASTSTSLFCLPTKSQETNEKSFPGYFYMSRCINESEGKPNFKSALTAGVVILCCLSKH